MVSIENNHPNIAMEFNKGNFIVHKFEHDLSAITLYQAQEQNKGEVDSYGDAVCITEDMTLLTRWMVAGPKYGN